MISHNIIIYSEIDFTQYNIDPKIRFLISKMTDKNPKLRSPIDKLLNLPIFSTIISKKLHLLNGLGRKNSYTTGFLAMTFENDFGSSYNNKNSQNDPLSYKNIHYYPNIQRVFGRSLAKPE